MLKTHAFKSIGHLDPVAFLHASCTLLITVLAFTFLHFFPTTQSAWFLLSCLLLSQVGLRAEVTWQSSWQTLFYLSCGFLTAAVAFMISLSATHFFLTAFLILIISLITGYQGWQKRQHFFAAFVITLFALLAAYSPTNQASALERFSFILLGSFFVTVPRFFFFLYQRRQAPFYAKVIFFQKLKKLYQLIFYSPKPSRFFRQELEESHFQIVWSDCLSALNNCKSKVTPDYASRLNRIWDVTLSLASLRYRLTDFTVLTMSQDEMRTLLKALLAIIDEQPEQNTDSALFESLQNAIQGFEQLYQSMLQTVAKEPLVLLLFIQDLYALKEEFEHANT